MCLNINDRGYKAAASWLCYYVSDRYGEDWSDAMPTLLRAWIKFTVICTAPVVILAACDRNRSAETTTTTAGVVSQPSVQPSGWEMISQKDELRETVTRAGILTSTDTTSLSSGETAADLQWIMAADGSGAIIRLHFSKGQLDCSSPSYSNLCIIDAKFENGPLVQFTGSRQDCGQDECLNLSQRAENEHGPDPELLIPTAHSFIIAVPFYKNGEYQFHFTTPKSLREMQKADLH